MTDNIDGDIAGNDNPNRIHDIHDNIIQPFQLEASDFRGRIVRLGSTIDDIIRAHNYPDRVNRLLGETLTLTALLSSMLKYDGIFTLQTSGDGPIKMLVADMTTAGDLRGCATFDIDRLEAATEQLAAFEKEEGNENQMAQLLGKGYIAFTVDQGQNTDRYQGIVELKGSSLTDCVHHYFAQSEQIETGIKMAVGKRNGKWRAGGIMLQHIPEEGGEKGVKTSQIDEDDWRRSMVLLESCKEDEFLDEELGENMLLLRLFHEEGVRVYEPQKIQKQCRCSEERVRTVLDSLSTEDIEHVTKKGEITMTCEFCSRDYVFDANEITRTLKVHTKKASQKSSKE